MATGLAQKLLTLKTVKEIPRFSELFESLSVDETIDVLRKLKRAPKHNIGEGGSWDLVSYEKQKHAHSPFSKIPLEKLENPDWDSWRKREFQLTGSTLRTDRLRHQLEQQKQKDAESEKELPQLIGQIDEAFDELKGHLVKFDSLIQSIIDDLDTRIAETEKRIEYCAKYSPQVPGIEASDFEFVSSDGIRFTRTSSDWEGVWQIPSDYPQELTPEILADIKANWKIQRTL
eukprot:TRINITY_DN298_c0_g1_i1.p1 TRINITY_DN298_c0_g1~~TRINITY_DN298_c0_g1_i1.p1  ORF type:complete len:246 (-),score=79.74 TRINITY_DN298_c0_g1_i1:81-773(-)